MASSRSRGWAGSRSGRARAVDDDYYNDESPDVILPSVPPRGAKRGSGGSARSGGSSARSGGARTGSGGRTTGGPTGTPGGGGAGRRPIGQPERRDFGQRPGQRRRPRRRVGRAQRRDRVDRAEEGEERSPLGRDRPGRIRQVGGGQEGGGGQAHGAEAGPAQGPGGDPGALLLPRRLLGLADDRVGGGLHRAPVRPQRART